MVSARGCVGLTVAVEVRRLARGAGPTIRLPVGLLVWSAVRGDTEPAPIGGGRRLLRGRGLVDVSVGTGGFLHEPLAHLPAISLQALVEEAALLTRVDRKYVLPARDLPDLLAAVPASTRALDMDGRRTFGYRSTYFDTLDLVSFHAAGRRRRRRFKVRMPHGDGEHRLSLDGRPFDDEALARAGIPAVRGVELSPVLVTAYRRSTLYLPQTRSRVTLDVELGWTSLLGAHRDLDRPATAIVETKTGATPSSFDRLLWAAGHRPVRISKYAVGMAALHPELPRMKWHDVMERRLDLDRPAAPAH